MTGSTSTTTTNHGNLIFFKDCCDDFKDLKDYSKDVSKYYSKDYSKKSFEGFLMNLLGGEGARGAGRRPSRPSRPTVAARPALFRGLGPKWAAIFLDRKTKKNERIY